MQNEVHEHWNCPGVVEPSHDTTRRAVAEWRDRNALTSTNYVPDGFGAGGKRSARTDTQASSIIHRLELIGRQICKSLTDFVKHARPIHVRLSRPLMNPEPVDFRHRRVWSRYPEQHSVGLLVDLKCHVGFQPTSVLQHFRDNDSPRLIKFYIHGIDHAIYHKEWKMESFAGPPDLQGDRTVR